VIAKVIIERINLTFFCSRREPPSANKKVYFGRIDLTFVIAKVIIERINLTFFDHAVNNPQQTKKVYFGRIDLTFVIITFNT